MVKASKKAILAAFISVLFLVTILIVGFADGSNPGSEQDPIVTQSYVTQVANQLKAYVDTSTVNIYQEITKLNGTINTSSENINNIKTQIDTQNQQIANLGQQIASQSQQIAALNQLVAAQDLQIKDLQQQLNNTSASTFEVMLLNKGKTLLTGQGTEVIVRSGICTAIATENGGLADTTEGKDLKTKDSITLNHLLISSRNDGRGLKAVEDSYIIVRGSYLLK